MEQACFHRFFFFFNSAFWKLIHPFRIGCFCTRYASVTCFASSSHFLCGYLDTFKSSTSFPNMDQWRIWAWTHRSKRHFFQRPAEFALYLLSVPVKKSEFRSSFPSTELDEEKFSGGQRCPSSHWPCRIHSSISTTKSFVFLPRRMWKVDWIVSPTIIPSRISLLLETIVPSFGEFDFWLVHRLCFLHKTESENTWTSA